MLLSRRVFFSGLSSATSAYLLSRSQALAATPLHVGDQKGGAQALITAAGLTSQSPVSLQWSLFAGAPMLIQALTAGAVNVGVIGDAPLVFAQAGGSPIKAVAAIQTDGTMTAIVVRKDSPIRSIQDLKGLSIATLKSQTGHYLTLAALRDAGMQDGDVRFVFVPPTAAKMALQNGNVDAWATWGPYIADAKIHDGAREIVNGGRLMSGLSYVVATDEALQSQRNDIIAYSKLLRDGHRWALTHAEDYAVAWSRETGLSLPVAREVVRTSMASITPITPDIIGKQQGVSDFMTATKMIPGSWNAKAVTDSTIAF
ncbi:nitrate/sulfonate/bicarbonate ABC transporter substrate-binding periplasmic protein [Acetobacter malorum DSM 14337]|uniref:Nitrate/sulfonate/bicarbonate ABC transporter substrate-binding periplasmic protein n=1 Tax=Acetobacter malorum DSM 14337 TaxID=1307910 RepID=A0ABQ0PTM1_9PROT|nr:ABC transporter substrate-binding protein [Acetobacter malorum]KXV04934.1 alkanesulfonate ABC transporter substrate-binding protein [Acetobacter malorum]GBQ80362.1 nitrate/sulfonate/bicarbonate ABC transporter substrate-binding periplasmic protein [Acetobacter malorum DSM 14337]